MTLQLWPCNLWWRVFLCRGQTSIKGQTSRHQSLGVFSIFSIQSLSYNNNKKKTKNTTFAMQHSTSWHCHWCQTVVRISSDLLRDLHPDGWSNATPSWNWYFNVPHHHQSAAVGALHETACQRLIKRMPFGRPLDHTKLHFHYTGRRPARDCFGILWTNVAHGFVNSKL